MQLTKKQVKAFLEVISSDTSRPVICTAKVDTYEGRTVLIATDGYQLAALDAPGLKGHEGKLIDRTELIKWYKLAGTKDRLDEKALIEMPNARDDDKWYGEYPEWVKIIEAQHPGEITKIALNARYMLTMQTLADKTLVYTANGQRGAVTAREDNNLYVIMPLKV